LFFYFAFFYVIKENKINFLSVNYLTFGEKYGRHQTCMVYFIAAVLSSVISKSLLFPVQPEAALKFKTSMAARTETLVSSKPIQTMYQKEIDLKRLQFIAGNIAQAIKPGSTVLDIGCGNGHMSMALGQLGFQVYGIDVSEKTIAKARQLNTMSHVSFDVMPAEALVADGQKYDAVVCSEVLEHLNQPDKLLEVIYQLLNDEGRLIVTVPNGYGPREVLITKPVQWMQKNDNLIWKMVKGVKSVLGYDGKTVQSDADDLGHIQFFTRKALKNLAQQTNFQIVRFGKADFLSEVFPFSMLARRSRALQKLDCKMADALPYAFTCGFYSVWQKKS
jgi:2-polyprenyl-3-methyl-5-hydroxy-6-metoxy-1,4-benzoquinol methylase